MPRCAADAARRKRHRWQTASNTAVAVLRAADGRVRLHGARKVENTISGIESNLDRPVVALQMLEQSFPDESSERIGELRNRIYLLHQSQQRELYTAWSEDFDQAMAAILEGDPIVGLDRTLALSEAPEVDNSTNEQKRREDLFGAITKRFVEQSREDDLGVHERLGDHVQAQLREPRDGDP